MARPVCVVASGGSPFVSVSDGPPATPVADGPPITLVEAGAPPICLVNDDGSAWFENVADADYGWDFIANQAIWNSASIGALANTPNWTFTRASTAYYRNSSGLLTSVASGVLRTGDRGALIEGARTNRCLYARDMTNAAWTKSNATAALDQVGMDGAANSASSLTATAGNATCLQAITNASVARNYSFWVKRITGTGNIDITTDNGATWATISGITTTGWVRGTVTQTLADPTVGVRIVTSGDAIAVDFCQEETGAFPSSPILTTTASATRAADVLIVPVSGIDYPLTLFAETQVDTLSPPTSRCYMQVDDSTSTNRALIYGTPGAGTASRIYVATGGVQQALSSVGTLANGVIRKTAARAAANDFIAAGNGTLATADTSGTLPATPNLIRFGKENSAGTELFGYLRRAAIFSRALSDAELQAVTL